MTRLSLLTVLMTTALNFNISTIKTKDVSAIQHAPIQHQEPLSLLPAGERPAQVVMGFNHSSVLMSNHQVYMWGRNQAGQLGNESLVNSQVPVNITDKFPAGDNIIQLALGQDYSSALTENGQVYMWGQNNFGQLGNGTTTSSSLPVNITDRFPTGDTVIALSLGWFHAGAVTESGRVYVWGFNGFGELGDGSTTSKNVPTEITSLYSQSDRVISLSFGNYFSSAKTLSGNIFAWGWNSDGQLGDGTTTDRKVPTEVTSGIPLNQNETILQYQIGGYHAGVLTSNGRMFTWGRNIDGQVGNGTTTNQVNPINITSQFPVGDKIVSISVGANHTSARLESGVIYIWGSTFRGRLGDGGVVNRLFPVSLASQFDQGVKFAQISLGANHSSALTTRGYVYTWGFNDFGQLGIGNTTEFNVPKLITALVPAPFSVINLNTNGGDALIALEGEPASPLEAPQDPTKIGHTFAGWFEDEALTIPYVFTVFPEEDITIYAKWTINNYTLTFVTDGGNTVNSISQAFGSSITAPANPTKQGYLFSGWNPSIPSTMPAENITITALWELDVDAVETVIEAIDNLPSPEDITLADEPAVEAVRTAYNNLIDEQKVLVTNFQTLVDVELQIQALSSSFPWWILLVLIPLGYLGYRYRSFFFLLIAKKDDEDEDEKEDKLKKKPLNKVTKPTSKTKK